MAGNLSVVILEQHFQIIVHVRQFLLLPLNEWMNEGRKEGRKSRGWEDNRRTLLKYILTCEQQARTSAYKGATGSRSQSIYELTVPIQPMMWMMWCVKVDHNTEVYVPYSFRTVVWVLLRPTRTRWVPVLWDETNGFSSLSEKTRKTNCCRCHYKGSTFFSFI